VYEREISLNVKYCGMLISWCESVGETVEVGRGQLMARWRVVLIIKPMFWHEHFRKLDFISTFNIIFLTT
jgi:hypothetical protein